MDYGQILFLYILALKLADAAVVVAAWHLAWFLRFQYQWLPLTHAIPPFEKYAAVALPLALAFSAVFHVIGAYRRDRIRFGFRTFKKIAQGSILGTLIFISFLYFLEESHYSRIYLLVFVGVCCLCLFIERIAMEIIFRTVEPYIVRRIRTLLIGTGPLLQMYFKKISERNPYPVKWLGRLGPPPFEGIPKLPQLPYLGIEEQLEDYLRNHSVDVAVLSYPTDEMSLYEKVLEILSNELVAVKLLPDFGRFSTFTYSADQECGIPLLHFNQAPLSATDRSIKRILDIIVAFLFLTLFSPLYFLIATLIKITSKGPVFYGQTRIGADGSLFTCYKFRSMFVGAETKTGAVWAVQDDPRTTPLGKWLRRTSLDELPQFYNVLRGDMSLVGPRPERPFFVNQFRREIPKYMLRHRMKSGITGWAQVNGWRGNTSIDERIKHDLFYIGHWSHFFDFKIMVLTFFKGFINRHAY